MNNAAVKTQRKEYAPWQVSKVDSKETWDSDKGQQGSGRQEQQGEVELTWERVRYSRQSLGVCKWQIMKFQ